MLTRPAERSNSGGDGAGARRQIGSDHRPSSLLRTRWERGITMTTGTQDRLTEMSGRLHELAESYPRELFAPDGPSHELEVRVMGLEDRQAMHGLAESLS